MSDYESQTGCAYPDYMKDPDSTIDFEFSWVSELNGDAISSAEFLLPDGLTEVSTANTTNTATIFVSGGNSGSVYRITSRITSIGGRVMDKTIQVLCRDT